MTPVYMQETNDCFQACLASILDLPYDTVFPPRPGMPYSTMYPWFAFHGHRLLRMPIPGADLTEALAMANRIQQPGHYILSGNTIKGVEHAVVCFEDRVVHDPAKPAQPLISPLDNGMFMAFHIGVLL